MADRRERPGGGGADAPSAACVEWWSYSGSLGRKRAQTRTEKNRPKRMGRDAAAQRMGAERAGRGQSCLGIDPASDTPRAGAAVSSPAIPRAAATAAARSTSPRATDARTSNVGVPPSVDTVVSTASCVTNGSLESKPGKFTARGRGAASSSSRARHGTWGTTRTAVTEAPSTAPATELPAGSAGSRSTGHRGCPLHWTPSNRGPAAAFFGRPSCDPSTSARVPRLASDLLCAGRALCETNL